MADLFSSISLLRAMVPSQKFGVKPITAFTKIVSAFRKTSRTDESSKDSCPTSSTKFSLSPAFKSSILCFLNCPSVLASKVSDSTICFSSTIFPGNCFEYSTKDFASSKSSASTPLMEIRYFAHRYAL